MTTPQDITPEKAPQVVASMPAPMPVPQVAVPMPAFESDDPKSVCTFHQSAMVSLLLNNESNRRGLLRSTRSSL